MNALELLKKFQKESENLVGEDLVTPIMYNPIDLEKNVSFAILAKTPKGLYKRFIITVKDNGEIKKGD